jgi:hypothetical protein
MAASERFHTVTRCPAAQSRRTIGRPIRPSPANPIGGISVLVDMEESLGESDVYSQWRK